MQFDKAVLVAYPALRTKQLRSEAAKCNILISPLEGEKKFLSELCELRNFREGYKKYKNSDRATECAMTCGKIV
mgnify:CR=1 FL=1